MGKIIIDGQELRAVTLNTAPSRAVIALQQEVGLTLQQITDRSKDPMEQVWALKVQEFLSEHNRGNRVTFDELLDRPIPGFVLSADEIARYQAAQKAGEGGGDPTSAGTATPAGNDPEQLSAPSTATPNRTERRASTRAASSSGGKSRGSKGKSAPASSSS